MHRLIFDLRSFDPESDGRGFNDIRSADILPSWRLMPGRTHG
jgi:hypothetical protein